MLELGGRRTVITGIGPMASTGIGKKNFWNGLVGGSTGLVEGHFKISESFGKKFFLHKLKGFQVDGFNFDKQLLQEIEEWRGEGVCNDVKYFLASISLAIADSNLSYDKEENEIGVILTAESPGHGEFFGEIIRTFYECPPEEKSSKKKAFEVFYSRFQKIGYDLQTFMPLYSILKVFQFKGFSLFINNACASGLYALDLASLLIKTGRCRQVFVSSVEHPDIFKLNWFQNLKMMPLDGLIKPFDRFSSGFALGEAGVTLLVEDLEMASKRGAFIYGEYLGGKFMNEAWKITLPKINSRQYVELINNLYHGLDIKPSQTDLIVPHGVGTKISDLYEINILKECFSKVLARKSFVTALKPYVGHTLGASGLIDVAILLLMMTHETILPTLNVDRIFDDLKEGLVIKIRENQRINLAIKMCNAFAGFNGACLLSSARCI